MTTTGRIYMVGVLLFSCASLAGLLWAYSVGSYINALTFGVCVLHGAVLSVLVFRGKSLRGG